MQYPHEGGDRRRRPVVLNGVGGYETGIAISTPVLDLWIHKPVPVRGQFCEIILPAAAKLVLRYDIESGEPEATMLILLAHDGRNEAVNSREVKVANGGNVVLDHLMPGTCRIWRRKTLEIVDAKHALFSWKAKAWRLSPEKPAS